MPEVNASRVVPRGRVRRIGRRVFLAGLGRGTVAAAVFSVGFVACGGDDEAATPVATATATGAAAEPTASATVAASPAGSAATAGPAAGQLPAEWRRVLLGNVSAYVLVRGGEAAVVDTGVAGSADEIAAGLSALGAGWESVGHVIVTHSHPDHQGSLAEVLAAAADATAYAGAGDIPAITSPRALVAVGDGDRVFDLEIIESPGHTPGHISVLDSLAGVLVAGDALNGEGGGVAGPNARFTPDMAAAIASAVKLGTYEYDSVVFGHGDPVVGDASRQVAALAATL